MQLPELVPRADQIAAAPRSPLVLVVFEHPNINIQTRKKRWEKCDDVDDATNAGHRWVGSTCSRVKRSRMMKCNTYKLSRFFLIASSHALFDFLLLCGQSLVWQI